MIHSWGLVRLGWQDQLPLAKLFLAVGMGELVPAIYRGVNRKGFKNVELI